ncbi:anion permease [Bisgaard Taxon 10/6]|uniref:anion permease n=1 Tax=Exercitatus varius TaxID=67857 RepID=UPI0018A5D413|nr:anion permease [Exercitatus varius]MDG2943726.1 anion permease [Exercitatus varius]MDG2957279.1 anion permease [Exercitatus varius]MDG2961183.1 anion permease [Exercitatus varius]QOF67690.1 anion permease [Actinobacillus sp. GY-402]
MDAKKLIRYAVILAFPILTYIFPAPDGLPLIGWHLLGVYIGTIIALILKPFPAPTILLAAVAIAAVMIGNTPEETVNGAKVALKQSAVLDGYKSGTTWLVFAAFSMSAAFVQTGLGRRIAYKMIGAFGSTTLRLGYVNALLDLLISPAMPSTTARGGGIMAPIMQSIAVSLGSEPDKSPRKAGHYLLLNTYMVVKTTGYITLTAMAPNAVALELMRPILHIDVNWTQWFIAACVPGFVALLLMPFVTYVLYKPELKEVDNKEIARKGLEEMGPMKVKEKILSVLFIGAVLGWVFSGFLHLSEFTVAIAAMALILLTSVLSWDDVLKNRAGWTTLTWYGGLLGIAAALKQANFFEWLSSTMSTLIPASNSSPLIVTIFILILSVAVRYLFASGAAYVASMVPVFSAVGLAAGADPLLLALGLLFSNSYGSMVTHYGSAPAAVIYGLGYHDLKSFWITGGVCAIVTLLIHVTIGFGWWSILQNMNLFG